MQRIKRATKTPGNYLFHGIDLNLNAENKKSDEDTPTTSDEEIDALLGG